MTKSTGAIGFLMELLHSETLKGPFVFAFGDRQEGKSTTFNVTRRRCDGHKAPGWRKKNWTIPYPHRHKNIGQQALLPQFQKASTLQPVCRIKLLFFFFFLSSVQNLRKVCFVLFLFLVQRFFLNY